MQSSRQCAIISTSRLADIHCNIARAAEMLLLLLLLLQICTFIDHDGDSQNLLQDPALHDCTTRRHRQRR